MATKPLVAIVGAGRLGRTLTLQLAKSGYRISEILHRPVSGSARRASALARQVQARAVPSQKVSSDAGLIWLCVPDREISSVAAALAAKSPWKGRIVFHSSGALASDELGALRKLGASVAAVHPFMTFAGHAATSLKDVPFAVEGDKAAVRLARAVVKDLGGEFFLIAKSRKAAYHAFGSFISPLLIALLATAEQVAKSAGMTPAVARRRMIPILSKTLENYAKVGGAKAFTGPIVRGDSEVVGKHLQALRGLPQAKAVYEALALSALGLLPSQKPGELKRLLTRKKVSTKTLG